MKKMNFFSELDREAHNDQIKCCAKRDKAREGDKLKSYWEAYVNIERENEKCWEDFLDWLCGVIPPETEYNTIERKTSFKTLPEYRENLDQEKENSSIYEL
jgi:hypothetical protein